MRDNSPPYAYPLFAALFGQIKSADQQSDRKARKPNHTRLRGWPVGELAGVDTGDVGQRFTRLAHRRVGWNHHHGLGMAILQQLDQFGDDHRSSARRRLAVEALVLGGARRFGALRGAGSGEPVSPPS